VMSSLYGAPACRASHAAPAPPAQGKRLRSYFRATWRREGNIIWMVRTYMAGNLRGYVEIYSIIK
jgi:hypothetical protein